MSLGDTGGDNSDSSIWLLSASGRAQRLGKWAAEERLEEKRKLDYKNKGSFSLVNSHFLVLCLLLVVTNIVTQESGRKQSKTILGR